MSDEDKVIFLGAQGVVYYPEVLFISLCYQNNSSKHALRLFVTEQSSLNEQKEFYLYLIIKIHRSVGLC